MKIAFLFYYFILLYLSCFIILCKAHACIMVKCPFYDGPCYTYVGSCHIYPAIIYRIYTCPWQIYIASINAGYGSGLWPISLSHYCKKIFLILNLYFVFPICILYFFFYFKLSYVLEIVPKSDFLIFPSELSQNCYKYQILNTKCPIL